MSFFGSILAGSSPTLDKAIPKAGQISGYSTGLGENLLTKSGNYFSDLLSGDPTKQMQALAPEISALQGRAGQAKKSLAEFGTRGGGTASAAANIDRESRAGINDMISKLTGGAASSAATMGGSLLDTGINALKTQVDFSQQQIQNWSDSILGKGLTTAAAYGESAGLNAIPGFSGTTANPSATNSGGAVSGDWTQKL